MKYFVKCFVRLDGAGLRESVSFTVRSLAAAAALVWAVEGVDVELNDGNVSRVGGMDGFRVDPVKRVQVPRSQILFARIVLALLLGLDNRPMLP